MRSGCWALLLAVLLLALATAASGAGPNIVLMLADDLGWNDVGYNGSEISTPMIDRLAADGLRLDRNYVFGFCTPTRVAIMTGRSPLRFGMGLPIIDQGGLPLDETTMGDVFRDGGYQTWFLGKWHLGHHRRAYLPNERGWDHSYGSLTGGLDHYSHNSDVLMGVPDWQRNGNPVEEEGHTTDLYTTEALRLIGERDTERPFFLYLAWNAPHTPLQAPERYLEEYARLDDEVRRTYCAMVSQIDDSVAAVIDALEKEGLREDTLVIWLSDNGGFVPGGADNSPFREGKASAHEGGVRVPGFVNWPGTVNPGALSQQVSAHDWLPTLVAAAGIASTATKPLDGWNMWPAIRRGESVQRGDLILSGRRGRAIFRGKWKYVETLPGPPSGRSPGPGRRGSAAGGPRGPRAGPPGRPGGGAARPIQELYDILADPTESENLADKHPELVEELAAAAHLIDRDAPRFPGGFMLRDGGRFQRLGPFVGFPEDRGSHVLDRLDE